MVNTVSLDNIHQHTQLKNFFLEMTIFLRFTLLATSNMQYSINHAVPYIPITYSLSNWRFVLFDPLNPTPSFKMFMVWQAKCFVQELKNH